MTTTKQVIVVGGGAAGMMAAISARRLGAQVTILERNPRVGKKILATGNGRCNYTNINADVTCYQGNNPKFVYSPLARFSVEDTIRFFRKLGIEPKVEERGKVFPMSEQASSFLDVFLYELDKLDIQVICNAFVKNIQKEKGKFRLTLAGGEVYQGDRVILATGGKAMPASGSDGNGYHLARKLGHTVTAIFPALVQLKLEGPFFKRIEGVKFYGTAGLYHRHKKVAMDEGDILFANYGVSGPPILQLSRKAGELLNQGQEAYLKINILHQFTKEEVAELIKKRIFNDPQKPAEASFIGLINKRLIPVVLGEAGIENLKAPAGSLKSRQIESIAAILTGWRFKIRGTKSWPSAQVTAGGVSTREINASTMESKLVEGLFFAGEIIDIDGLCGGFNLQWAWSSGFVAGENAAL